MSLRIDDSFHRHAQRQVFAYRLMVYSLGPQFGGNSANHFTINLLIGNGEHVRVDMEVDHMHDDLRGQLVVSGRSFLVSHSAITFIDLKARGCPNYFDPAAPAPAVVGALTAGQIVNLLAGNGRERFRFVYIGRTTDGCRYWVWSGLQLLERGGCFAQTNALASPAHRLVGPPPKREWGGMRIASEPSVWAFLTNQWDDRSDHPPKPWPFVNGLWIAATRCSSAQYRGILNRAAPWAIDRVGVAIQGARSESLGLQLRQAVGDPRRKTMVLETIFRDILTTRDLEITTDLVHSSILQNLAAGLHGRFELAERALKLAHDLRQHSSQPNCPQTIMALLLAAVLDMSGDPDEESDSDESDASDESEE